MSDITVTHEESPTRGRFVAMVDGYEAELTYSRAGDHQIIADHTGVPSEIGGLGVGSALTRAMIEDARARGLKIVPLCPFVNAQFRRHPEWRDLLA